jgi:Gpi18-like mannosyltransferase
MRRGTWRAALLAFLVSRAAFFAMIVLVSNIQFESKEYNGQIWKTWIEIHSGAIGPLVAKTVMTGDAWWYRSVAVDGYERTPFVAKQANWAFFPMFPWIVRAARITGDYAYDATIVSNLAFLGALLLLGAVATRAGIAADDAERAIWYLALFPTSYFFSMPLTESLFLLLSLGAVYAALRDRWWAAGLLGGLAAVTRVNGVLLLVPLAIFCWQRARRQLPWLLLIPAGTGAFMFMLHRITGNALAFRDVQSQWGRTVSPPWSAFFEYFRDPSTVSVPWNFVLFNCLVALALLATGIYLLIRREWAFGAYALVATLLPLISGSLQSMARYALVVFPFFLLLGMLGRRPAVDRVILAVSAALFGWFIALMALKVDFALA